MKNFNSKISIFLLSLSFLTGCARDLSSNVYTSDSTLNLTLQGEVISTRPITIKESDNLSNNTAGMLGGGAVGAAAGTNVGGGDGRTLAIVGGAVGGAIIGTLIQDRLGQSRGTEYIIKVDPTHIKNDYYEGNPAMRSVISAATTGGLITVIQGTKDPIIKGQRVYVIFSDKRTRVIAAS